MESFPEFTRPKEPSFDRVLRDYSQPQSLVNLVSPEIGSLIMKLPSDWVDVSEESLEKSLPNPDASTWQIRQLFWREYDRAFDHRTKMDMARTYVGVMSRNAFYKHVADPMKLAWIINPPTDYIASIEELHSLVMKQIRQIIMLPSVNSMGYVDVKLAEIKLKAMLALDMRLKGGYVQRSMQINQNINQNETRITHTSEKEAGKDLDSRIKDLELEIAAQEKKALEQRPLPQEKNILLTKQEHRVEPIEAEYKEVISGEQSG